MTRLQAIEASFIHWTDNYALVCEKRLSKRDIGGDKCALCSTGCGRCPLPKYRMQCGASSWWDIAQGLDNLTQPKRAVEVMTLCLLLVYFAEGGKKVWK